VCSNGCVCRRTPATEQLECLMLALLEQCAFVMLSEANAIVDEAIEPSCGPGPLLTLARARAAASDADLYNAADLAADLKNLGAPCLSSRNSSVELSSSITPPLLPVPATDLLSFRKGSLSHVSVDFCCSSADGGSLSAPAPVPDASSHRRNSVLQQCAHQHSMSAHLHQPGAGGARSGPETSRARPHHLLKLCVTGSFP